MSNKSRRRVKIAAGAILAGAAIPIAAAGTAWADEEISRDGTVVFDNFPGGPARGTSDVGSAAISGTDNDTAIYRGPASDYSTAATLYGGATAGVYGANDASAGDVNDVARASNSNAPGQTVSAADIFDATDSKATATNGGWVGVQNYGNPYGNPTPPSTATMTDDVASASGSGSAAFVENEGGTGTISGDDAHATHGAIAFVTDYSATGNVQNDMASAHGLNSFADVGNGYNATPSATGVDGSNEPVSSDRATASGGGTAIVGEDQNDTTVPVTHDVAGARAGGDEMLIDVGGQHAFASMP
jgi:hypothetical protein